MKPEKAIEILEEVKELDDTMYAYNPAYMNALDMAIEAFKEIQLYKDNKLCLVPEDVYSRQCSELDAYKEIGTVEECREAVEKQKPKKPDYEGDGYDDKGELVYDTWICPNCDKKYEVDYDDYKHCPNCGQSIDENLEGMEDE